jgi:hypothetical protein
MLCFYDFCFFFKSSYFASKQVIHRRSSVYSSLSSSNLFSPQAEQVPLQWWHRNVFVVVEHEVHRYTLVSAHVPQRTAHPSGSPSHTPQVASQQSVHKETESTAGATDPLTGRRLHALPRTSSLQLSHVSEEVVDILVCVSTVFAGDQKLWKCDFCTSLKRVGFLFFIARKTRFYISCARG